MGYTVWDQMADAGEISPDVAAQVNANNGLIGTYSLPSPPVPASSPPSAPVASAPAPRPTAVSTTPAVTPAPVATDLSLSAYNAYKKTQGFTPDPSNGLSPYNQWKAIQQGASPKHVAIATTPPRRPTGSTSTDNFLVINDAIAPKTSAPDLSPYQNRAPVPASTPPAPQRVASPAPTPAQRQAETNRLIGINDPNPAYVPTPPPPRISAADQAEINRLSTTSFASTYGGGSTTPAPTPTSSGGGGFYGARPTTISEDQRATIGAPKPTTASETNRLMNLNDPNPTYVPAPTTNEEAIAAMIGNQSSVFAQGFNNAIETIGNKAVDTQARTQRNRARLEELERNILAADYPDGLGNLPQDDVVMPIAGATETDITSPFGWRIHPIYGDNRHHDGTDFRANEGDPISAYSDGEVIFSGPKGGYGNVVIVKHTDGTESFHAHLSNRGVSAGDTVSAGDVIGSAGSTGNVTGSHLHFELRNSDGNLIDPAEHLFAGGENAAAAKQDSVLHTPLEDFSLALPSADVEIEPVAAGGADRIFANSSITGPPSIGATLNDLDGTPATFFRVLLPYAEWAGKQTGIDPRIILAQSALETGYGQHNPGNLFGIKGSDGPLVNTYEEIGGRDVPTTDRFKQLSSVEDNFQGYVDVVLSDGYGYPQLRQAESFDEQIAALDASGYASDSGYGADVRSIAGDIDRFIEANTAASTVTDIANDGIDALLGGSPPVDLSVETRSNNKKDLVVASSNPLNMKLGGGRGSVVGVGHFKNA